MQLMIKVIPQASANKIIGFYQGMLKVALNGVPEKGKLNELLLAVLADAFGIPKKSITIKQGLTNPIKRIQIESDQALKVEIYLAKFKKETLIQEDESSN